MFGHNDDQAKKDKEKDNNDSIPAESIDAALNVDESSQAQGPDATTPAPSPFTAATNPATPADNSQLDQPSNAPDEESKISDVVSPAGGFPRSTDSQVSSHPGPSISPSPKDDLIDSSKGDLVDIRQHALTELSPLLDELDLPPEERFHTLMMVIQASDDQKLLKEAYEAAHGITDEKARAQALLEVINEINYFTQQPES